MTALADPLREALESAAMECERQRIGPIVSSVDDAMIHNNACDKCANAVRALAALAQSPAPQGEEKHVPNIVKNAMRVAWDEICSDTDCHPLDIKHEEGRYLTFEPSHWTERVGTIVAEQVGEELEELRLIAEENADNVRLLDYIADKIGLSKEEELTRDNFRQWLQSVAPQGEGMREAAGTPTTISELEALINSEDSEPCVILPNGNVIRESHPEWAAFQHLASPTPIPSDRAGREEEIADALANCFKQAIEASAGKPFDQTGVTLPARKVWLNYAAALRQSASAGIERAAELAEAKALATEQRSRGDLGSMFAAQSAADLREFAKELRSLSASASHE